MIWIFVESLVLIVFRSILNGGRVSVSSSFGTLRVIVVSSPFCDFIEYILYSVGIIVVVPKRSL